MQKSWSSLEKGQDGIELGVTLVINTNFTKFRDSLGWNCVSCCSIVHTYIDKAFTLVVATPGA